MSKKCHYCGGDAELIGKNWNNEDIFRCKKCGKQGRDNCFSDRPTVFHRITASPEVLAEKLVYSIYDTDSCEWWTSTLCNYTPWKLKAEAIAATVARLKEVCVEQNAVDYTQARLSKVDDTQKEVAE